MRTDRMITRRPESGLRASAAWGCALVLLIQPCILAAPAGNPKATTADRTDLPAGNVPPVCDVTLDAGGVLHGRLTTANERSTPEKLAGKSVVLLQGKRPVAMTLTGSQGEFVFENISGGVYRVMVDPRTVSMPSHFRIWTAQAAPPRAQRRMEVACSDATSHRIARGQPPVLMPMMSLGQVATVAGITAGAIATPMIYHNAQRANQAPRSP